MQSIIQVNLAHQPYQIAIAPGALDSLGEKMQDIQNQTCVSSDKVLLVTNSTVFRLYGQRAIASLKQAGFKPKTCILPDGEQYKNLDSVLKIYNAALENRLERSSTLVALGGGVVDDLTGFAAATWLRGVNFVQIPTSLLAMIDAAIGGKTGVNYSQGKNLIGAFYQPRLVVVDPEVLQTLQSREFHSALAEIIKYGVVWDAELFHCLEATSNLRTLLDFQSHILFFLLSRSCQAKADIVAQDEKETSLRALLNYGHTIGHAVESLTEYRQFSHGEAVAIGMVAAGEIAVFLNLWSRQEAQRQLALIEKAGLPNFIPSNLEVEMIMEILSWDKKVQNGKVRFVLPTKIGSACVSEQVPPKLVNQILLKLKSRCYFLETSLVV